MVIKTRLKYETEVASKKYPLMPVKGWSVDSGVVRCGVERAGRATGDGVGDDVAIGAFVGAIVTTCAVMGADVAMGALLGIDVSGGDDDAMMHVTDATALQPPRWFPGPVLGGQSLLVLQMLP